MSGPAFLAAASPVAPALWGVSVQALPPEWRQWNGGAADQALPPTFRLPPQPGRPRKLVLSVTLHPVSLLPVAVNVKDCHDPTVNIQLESPQDLFQIMNNIRESAADAALAAQIREKQQQKLQRQTRGRPPEPMAPAVITELPQ